MLTPLRPFWRALQALWWLSFGILCILSGLIIWAYLAEATPN